MFPLGVRDLHYVNDKAWLFVSLSDMKLASRLDAYLTNVNLPWEKNKQDTQTYATVGAVLFYWVGVEGDGKTWNFTRIWAKNFPSQTNVMLYCATLKQLIVGLDSGKIHVYQITESAWGNPTGLEEIAELKTHAKWVMGLSYDPDLRYLTSIGEDGFMRVTDLSTKELQHEEMIN